MSSEWSKVGVSPPLLVTLVSLAMAALGIYGLVILWRTRSNLGIELAWIGIGMFTWFGFVSFGFGIFIGSVALSLVGCVMLAASIYWARRITSPVV